MAKKNRWQKNWKDNLMEYAKLLGLSLGACLLALGVFYAISDGLSDYLLVLDGMPLPFVLIAAAYVLGAGFSVLYSIVMFFVTLIRRFILRDKKYHVDKTLQK